jgi:membrane protein DedA with SNARE-associated domain
VSPEQFIGHYGAMAVFVGGLVGGPILVTLGGLLTHQHLMPPWISFLCAALGSIVSNQTLYLAGRLFRNRPVVLRAAGTPAAAIALDFVARHPISYVFLYRFVMGIRSISPLLLGVTARIDGWRFAVLNLFGATIWAAAFTALGYFSGATIDVLLARTRWLERDLIGVALIVVLIAGLAGLQKYVRQRMARRRQDTAD